MNEYFKELHSLFCSETQDKKMGLKNLSSMSKMEMDAILTAFIETHLCKTVFKTDRLTDLQKQQVVQSMMVFLFSHRHTKDDQFIVETRNKVEEHPDDLHMDFTIVRNVMY